MCDEEINTEILWQRPGFLIRRLNQVHHAIFYDMLKGEITPLQYGLLTVLNTQSGLDQTALSEELGADRTTLAATIELLEKRQLLKREMHYSDKRRKVVNITLKGRRLLTKTQQQMHEAQLRLLAPLSAHERQQFLSLMKQLVEGNNHIASVPVKHFE
ncbi:MarR family transcriptional regulator [Pectobacterium cacticida]|uniref:MarR family transcriptional regulator n=1 Tax=Pectobacterium cacticida TaxID=69221 RepID=A0ABZ2GDE2_9GAMM|nr:MarR family transcriptional regulator [Pectobacterium cacticida]UYX06146.1 MarR family transcriptional regulator [Pectobacterium cacticida]